MQSNNGDSKPGRENVDEAAFVDSFFLPGGILDPFDVDEDEDKDSTALATGSEEGGAFSSGMYLSSIPTVASYSPWGSGLVGVTASPLRNPPSSSLAFPINSSAVQPILSPTSLLSGGSLTADSASFVPGPASHNWLSSDDPPTIHSPSRLRESSLVIPTISRNQGTVAAPPGFESSLAEQKPGWAAVVAASKVSVGQPDEKFGNESSVDMNASKSRDEGRTSLKASEVFKTNVKNLNDSHMTDSRLTATAVPSSTTKVSKSRKKTVEGNKVAKKEKVAERAHVVAVVREERSIAPQVEGSDGGYKLMSPKSPKSTRNESSNSRNQKSKSSDQKLVDDAMSKKTDTKSSFNLIGNLGDSKAEVIVKQSGLQLSENQRPGRSPVGRNQGSPVQEQNYQCSETHSAQKSKVVSYEAIDKVSKKKYEKTSPSEDSTNEQNSLIDDNIREESLEPDATPSPNRSKAARNREKRQDVAAKKKSNVSVQEKSLSTRTETNTSQSTVQLQNEHPQDKRVAENFHGDTDNNAGAISWFGSFGRSTIAALCWIVDCYRYGLVPFVTHSISFLFLIGWMIANSFFLGFLVVANIFKFAADESTSHSVCGIFWGSPSVLCYYVFCLMPIVCNGLMMYVGNLPHFTPHLLSNLAVYYVCRLLSQVSADALSQRRKTYKKSSSANIGISISSYGNNLNHLSNSDRFGNEVCQLILRIIAVALLLGFFIDGFSNTNSSFMLLEAQKRMILAYLLSLVKRGLILSPVAWLGWSVQVLLSAYLPAGLILNSVQFLIGLAFIRLVTLLQSEGLQPLRI